jgi:hypothetical protein
MFASKAGAYPRVEHLKGSSMGYAVTLFNAMIIAKYIDDNIADASIPIST